MIDRITKLRWRRRIRRSKNQVQELGSQAEEHIERHFFKRISRLPGVFRFTSGWIGLLVLLIIGVAIQTKMLGNYYLMNQPIAGGTYVEGMLGSFTNANPLYATSSVDSSVAHLVFAGLLHYNEKNQLVGDLAQTWKVDDHATQYTVKLRPNLHWQDGKPLTAEDVVFTYQLIQNPDAKSPLFPSWQGIKVSAIDAQTVQFVLPNALSAFPYSMTNGIVPKHLLKDVPITQLRSIGFNTANPVGAGPFKWEDIQVTGDTPEEREEQIALVPNENFYGEKVKLNKLIIRSFHDEKRMVESFNKQELNGMAGLGSMPQEQEKESNIYRYDIPLQSEVLVFFRSSSEALGDVKVRQALTEATDSGKILKDLGYPAKVANEPLLKTAIGYNGGLAQLGYNLGGAQKLLDDAGWKFNDEGLRIKNGKTLTLSLYSQSNTEYEAIARELQKQWRLIGVDVVVSLQEETDLQATIAQRSYDALLYGIELGADPDVFPYWHSSQADVRSQNRLNFSDYKSPAADRALEAGRTRTDPAIRAVKYKPFLETWRSDAPAIALYQPRFLYITRGQLFGFNPTTISNGVNRYENVENWMIREGKTVKDK